MISLFHPVDRVASGRIPGLLGVVLIVGTSGLAPSSMSAAAISLQGSQLPSAQTLRPKLTLTAERNEINAMAVSPDGSLMVTVVSRLRRPRLRRLLLGVVSSMNDTRRSDSVLKLWDLRGSQLKRTINDLSVGYFRTITFSLDGRMLAASDESWPRRIKVWDLNSGKLVLNVRGDLYNDRSAFSPDGNLLAITEMPPIKQCSTSLFDLRTGMLVATLPLDTKLARDWDNACSLGVYFSNDGRRLITTSSDRDSALWDAGTGKRVAVLAGASYSIFHDPSDGPTEMFSPDGKLAVTLRPTYQPDKMTLSAELWDAETGALIRHLETASAPVRFSPDGKTLASAGWRTPGTIVELWDVTTGKLIRTLKDTKGGCSDIIWSRDGQTIATAGDKLRVWNVSTGRLKSSLPAVVDWGWDFGSFIKNWDRLYLSPDNNFLIAANNKSTRLIDVGTGALLERIDKLRLPAFFTSQGYWATLTLDRKSVTLWEISPN